MERDTEGTLENNRGFGLPQDYFARSAAGIVNKIAWQQEHSEFPGLLALNRHNPFSVPLMYFEGSTAELELLEFELLRDKIPLAFIVPPSYFESSSKNLVSALSTLNPGKIKSEPFSVPPSYFEDSARRIRSANQPQQKARVIRLRPRIFVLSLAAMLLIVIGVWSYNIFFDQGQGQGQDCGTIACVDRKDLLESKSIELMDETEFYDMVNVKELERSLNKKEDKPLLNNDSANDITDEELMDNI